MPNSLQPNQPKQMKEHPMRDRKIKILIAKPGLDGHDRGAKIVALALRDAGMEVVYTGLHQGVEQIVSAALQEAVDIIGLSIMSGAHMTICEKLLELMSKEGIRETGVVVGGVIPANDIDNRKNGHQGRLPWRHVF